MDEGDLEGYGDVVVVSLVGKVQLELVVGVHYFRAS